VSDRPDRPLIEDLFRLENPQSVLWILRCGTVSFSPDPRMSGFLSVMLRANMDICFTRCRCDFSIWCILSFSHFLSKHTINIIKKRAQYDIRSSFRFTKDACTNAKQIISGFDPNGSKQLPKLTPESNQLLEIGVIYVLDDGKQVFDNNSTTCVRAQSQY
jgi:hypothetical protein